MKQPYEDHVLKPAIAPGWGRVFIILALLAILVGMFLLSGCASRAPMVRTTTTSAAPRTASGAAGGATTTVTEQPYESETHKRFGDAAANLFAQ